MRRVVVLLFALASCTDDSDIINVSGRIEPNGGGYTIPDGFSYLALRVYRPNTYFEEFGKDVAVPTRWPWPYSVSGNLRGEMGENQFALRIWLAREKDELLPMSGERGTEVPLTITCTQLNECEPLTGVDVYLATIP